MRNAALIVVAALAAGIGLGAYAHGLNDARVDSAIGAAGAIGGLWLNALRMTVVPLLFALLVTGVGAVADAAATGRLAYRAMALFAALVVVAALYGVAATGAALALWPVDPDQARAFIAAAPAPEPFVAPDFAQWFAGLMPPNPIAAAAEGQVLQIVAFAIVLGFAATRLPEDLRAPFIGFHRALAEAMITIVRWVLALAPLGVFALALTVGAQAGAGAVGILFQYVVIVSLVTFGSALLAFVIGVAFGRMPALRFAAASAPVWAVAFSTQSSLASLPLMVERTRDALGVAPRIAGVVLPMAVAIFRFTSPVANLAVALFIAALYGLEPSAAQIAAAIAVAFVISVGSVGLPGQVSFFASVAPICAALGAPIDLLPILLAVEVIPDIFRTLGNVTADMAATTILARDEKPAQNA
jgi:Na+/H+-dicarboxylate symporter